LDLSARIDNFREVRGADVSYMSGGDVTKDEKIEEVD
jgi:hypothetical protein